MLRNSFVATMIFVAGTASAAVGGMIAWSYDGATGPEHWGDLSKGWATCADGRYQSPIDLRGAVPVELEPLVPHIKQSRLVDFDLDGPTFAVPYDAGSQVTVNGTTYAVQQFHFHHPSEHTVDGTHYAMEAHLVMRSAGSDHNDAVMGVFVEPGQESTMLNQFWDQLPRRNGKNIVPVEVNIGGILPADKAYYMYEGSMTTPGCPEGVRWFVLQNPAQASQAQIDGFIGDMTQGDFNNRPVQATNGRVIVKSS